MEAMAGVSRSGLGVAGCFGTRPESLHLCAEVQNSVFPRVRTRVSLRSGAHFSFPSAGFEDQSHVQFYGDVVSGLRKDRFMNSVTRKGTSSSAAAVAGEQVKDGERDKKATKKAEKVEKKRLKKIARASADVSSSSSSSSSSESEANETVQRVVRSRRESVEQLRREWESISRSAVMNSIPKITADFVIEQPRSPAESSRDVRHDEGKSSSATVAQVLNSLRAMGMSSSVGVVEAPNMHGFATPGPNFAVSSNLSPSRLDPSTGAVAGVEVCMGGKCRKAGAQEVLSAFQAIGVNASACNKCMKNCKLAINVRVREGHDKDPKMYSRVGVEDVKLLSRQDSGLGQIPSHAACL